MRINARLSLQQTIHNDEGNQLDSTSSGSVLQLVSPASQSLSVSTSLSLQCDIVLALLPRESTPLSSPSSPDCPSSPVVREQPVRLSRRSIPKVTVLFRRGPVFVSTVEEEAKRGGDVEEGKRNDWILLTGTNWIGICLSFELLREVDLTDSGGAWVVSIAADEEGNVEVNEAGMRVEESRRVGVVVVLGGGIRNDRSTGVTSPVFSSSSSSVSMLKLIEPRSTCPNRFRAIGIGWWSFGREVVRMGEGRGSEIVEEEARAVEMGWEGRRRDGSLLGRGYWCIDWNDGRVAEGRGMSTVEGERLYPAL